MSLRGMLESLSIQRHVRPVLMTEELVGQLLLRDAEGNRLQVVWGDRDPDGFFTPTLVKDPTDNVAKAAVAAAKMDLCVRLREWAAAAKITSPRITALPTHPGEVPLYELTVGKSDLLGRIIYGGERPSRTECPVHKGVWSGCHGPWPGWISRGYHDGIGGPITERPAVVDPYCQAWYDQGCRCWSHRGSSCTTGWQPDAACGCLPG